MHEAIATRGIPAAKEVSLIDWNLFLLIFFCIFSSLFKNFSTQLQKGSKKQSPRGTPASSRTATPLDTARRLHPTVKGRKGVFAQLLVQSGGFCSPPDLPVRCSVLASALNPCRHCQPARALGIVPGTPVSFLVFWLVSLFFREIVHFWCTTKNCCNFLFARLCYVCRGANAALNCVRRRSH